MVDIGEQDEAGWHEACRQEAAIRDLLTRYPKRLTIGLIESVVWELGISRATLYRLFVQDLFYGGALVVAVTLSQIVRGREELMQ